MDGIFPALVRDSMKRQTLKMFVVSLVTFVLLYYSAAWAVLSCFDGEDHFHERINASEMGSYDSQVHLANGGHRHDFIDCAAPEFHVETLAGPVSLAFLVRAFADLQLHSNDSLRGGVSANALARFLGLNYLFRRTSNLPQLSDIPLYLSLAVLRI
jgi:hypothetical protein